MRQLKWLSLLALLLLGPSTYAQSVRFQSQAISSRGAGIANATVAVCTQPANTNTQPCSPLATLATSTITTSGGANPLTADSFGNFFFYAAPGRYTVQIYGPAVSGQFVVPDVDIQGVGGIVSGSINGDIWLDNVRYTNVQQAVNACPTNGTACTIHIPNGTWPPAAANTALTINASNVHIQCSGMDASTISYTGSVAITAVIDIGTSPSGSPSFGNISISGCTVSGNSNATYAIRLRSIHRSEFSHMKLINVTTAGINTNFAVADIFDDLHTSSQEAAFTTQPASCMILDGPDASHQTTAASVRRPVCEGVSGTGIVLNQTSGVHIYGGGTSEQNNKGITLSANAISDYIEDTDLESNAVANVEDSGFQNQFINLHGNGTYHSLTATESNWSGMGYDQITVDVGSRSVIFANLGYDNSGTKAFTNNSTSTVKRNVINLATLAFDLDLGNTQPTLTLKKGSGAGAYTTASTTYVVVDSTNQCYTVTIPTGWKLGIQASGILSSLTAPVQTLVALTDNAACSTANAGVLVESATVSVSAGNGEPYSLSWLIVGDGASHNVALQFKTSNAADSASLSNSGTVLPTMVFTLVPSN